MPPQTLPEVRWIGICIRECDRGVHSRGYRPEWVNQRINLVSGIILDTHPVIKQAGMMENATSNAARSAPFGCRYRGVNDVFTVEVTGQNG